MSFLYHLITGHMTVGLFFYFVLFEGVLNIILSFYSKHQFFCKTVVVENLFIIFYINK